MGKYTQAPWMAVTMDGGRLVLDTNGAPVCALPDNLRHNAEEMAANAELIALAPELFRSVCELVAVMRASDVELSPGKSVEGEGWDAALDDAQALLDLLAEDDVMPDDADAAADGVVVIPLPMMQPSAVVAVFKAANGDIGFIVHADDEPKTFIGQYGIAPPLFAWARSALQDDGPLCGVLRDNRRIVGEIGFYPGRILKLTQGDHTQSVELAQEDIDDIVSLFGEN